MAQYELTFTNGTASKVLPAGKYTVTSNVPGYTGTLSPTSFTATKSAGTQAFTIAATGTMTITVNETGASGGTAVTGGSFIRCNTNGTTNYGTSKTVSSSGICTFDNVPFGNTQAPAKFYIKQLTSDSGHNVQDGIIEVTMPQQSSTMYVKNEVGATQQFTLADSNYSGNNLNGTLTFDGPTQS